MNDCEIRALNRRAAEIRLHTLEAVHRAGSGHPGGSLSIAEMLAALYARMRTAPQNPGWPGRDRLVLSKGHAAPALYAALALAGYFPVEDLGTLRTQGSSLQGHPDMRKTPGVDFSTGSLGVGFSAAVGMALAGKSQGRDFRVYCILGDGELQEGIIWEAAATAAHYGLDNLTALVDVNGLQIDGTTEAVMFGGRERARFAAFGWHTIDVDGHDAAALSGALDAARAHRDGPAALLCRTVKGKGVSFMEGRAEWHGQTPDAAQYEQAVAALRETLHGWEAEA